MILQRFCFVCLTASSTLAVAQNISQGAPRGIVTVPSVKQEGIFASVADLAYDHDSDSQKLDLYRPSLGSGPFPVVLYIHGGGFKFGTRTMASAALVKSFLNAGYAVASVDYRLSGEAKFPAAVQDVFSAMAFVKTNAAQYLLDPNSVAVYGESAGANLAALIGTAYSDPVFRKKIADQAISTKPMAVIAHYPPVDFSQIDSMLKAQGCAANTPHNDATSFESAYLGGALPTVLDRVVRANPAKYAAADNPPFFIQNGDADCNVGTKQSSLLQAALTQAGASSVYEVIPGAGHGGPQFETPENIAKIVAFLERSAR